MNPVAHFLTVFLLMCLHISQIECGKRYSTGTGSYTDETIDEIISDEDIEQSDDSFGRAVGLGDSSSYEDCAERFGCSDDSIDEDYVYCEGYYGCYEADITATYDAFMDGCHAGHEAQITTGESLYCGGYVGCFMSESVTSGDTVCDGLYGCYNGIMYSTDDFYLLGYIATIASELYGNRSEEAGGDSIYAFGYNTAKFSVVNYVNNIYNYGAYGMYMTDVFTTDVDEFTMVNYGRYSTAYTSVYCSHKTVCTIYCRDTGCYNLEIRVARKSYVYVYYENEDCDSEPDIIVAKSAQDELEWELMYQQKAKLRRQAIDEFKDKYGHEYLGFEEQGGDKMHQAFEEIWNSVRDRMGLETDCKSKSMQKSDITNMISINKKYNNHGSSSQLNVVYASEHHGIENGLKFKWDFGAYGLLTSIVVFGLMNLFKKNTRDSKEINQKSYTYQSI